MSLMQIVFINVQLLKTLELNIVSIILKNVIQVYSPLLYKIVIIHYIFTGFYEPFLTL